MNFNDQLMLRRLIVELDDTGTLYSAMGCALGSFYGKEIVERMVLTHRAIAADLAEHMRTMGARKIRRGGMLGELRARYASWRATTSADAELDCLVQIEDREARLMARLQEAAFKIAGLKQRLHHHLAALEDVSAPITSMLGQTARPRLVHSGMNPSRSGGLVAGLTSPAMFAISQNFQPAPGMRRVSSARPVI